MHNVYATKIETLQDCGGGCSFFFDVIAPLWEGATHEPRPLHRLCTLMRKMGARSFLAEELAAFSELTEEESAATIRCKNAVRAKAVRLTFFRSLPGSLSWHDLADGDLLGYAVVVTLTLPNGTVRKYVLESVVRAPTQWVKADGELETPFLATNYYVHCCRPFRTTIGTNLDSRVFEIVGTFFCQQNNLTHVCGHAALRAAINSAPFFRGEKLTNTKINQILGIDHELRKVGEYDEPEPDESDDSPSRGLNAKQLEEVIRSEGLDAHVVDFDLQTAVDYETYVYPLIESACPTILGVKREALDRKRPPVMHVVTAVGHTIDSDRWTPEARISYGSFPIVPLISSSNWADHFIVSDDNHGMYLTLPTDEVRNVLVPKYNPGLHAVAAIGIVPRGVTVSGYIAEQTAAWVMKRLWKIPEVGVNRWLGILKKGPFVCRTLLQERTDYVGAMESTVDSEEHGLSSAELDEIRGVLPKRFWVTEFTVPNLLNGNRSKLGDVVTRADATQAQVRNIECIVFAWMPGFARITPALRAGLPTWPLVGHVPILRTGGKPSPPRLEW
ncbi:MAG: hypothetical protein JXA69_12535 [Phycisphaerae bacterium]|nr:hypothetical protein [Phycisphaerae bacterium]